ncbi:MULTISPECIES: DUF1365 domain-containing protein [Vibrio]|uniref:DUF1365 domain-containing protein n=1 Tax=Vibrio TaxID=662 RepID=UPI000B5C927A|nr:MULTISPECIES: DUF1365 domain-containing protein [Vibrio]HBV76363.1 DUF1365 domain-containing protein [Vibrio sp.]
MNTHNGSSSSLGHGIYTGKIRHRRFTPAKHSFSYPLTMLGLELNELNTINQQHWILGTQWYRPVRFHEKDYIKSEPGNLSERIKHKVAKLGGDWNGHRVMMLAQCRFFGVYFSPVNFYYCFKNDVDCQYLLAEVSNTPWNERHYYLIVMGGEDTTEKAFHVSPFMSMEMKYHWKVSTPNNKALIHIENHNNIEKKIGNEIQINNNAEINKKSHKVFDATVALTKISMQPTNNHSITKMKSATTWEWLRLPFMTFKILQGIYWQALKLFAKKVPFVPYKPKRSS